MRLNACKNLEDFFNLLSFHRGSYLFLGTGSGLGTFVLNLLEDEFPEVYRFVTSVYPSGEDDVITSPYNSVLAMKELNEHADCVLPVENEVRNYILFLSFSFLLDCFDLNAKS